MTEQQPQRRPRETRVLAFLVIGVVVALTVGACISFGPALRSPFPSLPQRQEATWPGVAVCRHTHGRAGWLSSSPT